MQRRADNSAEFHRELAYWGLQVLRVPPSQNVSRWRRCNTFWPDVVFWLHHAAFTRAEDARKTGPLVPFAPPAVWQGADRQHDKESEE